MSPETIVIVSVGSAATLFLLSCSWWLWRHAPPPASAQPNRRMPASEPARASQTVDPNWMGWAPEASNQPGSAQPPLRPRRPVTPPDTAKPAGIPLAEAEPEIDGARTMFFTKKKPSSDRTEIFPEQLEAGRDPDAPVTVDQLQTTPNDRPLLGRTPPSPPQR